MVVLGAKCHPLRMTISNILCQHKTKVEDELNSWGLHGSTHVASGSAGIQHQDTNGAIGFFLVFSIS